MGIQINGQTDTISAVDGALTVSGADLPTVTNLNATGIVTASGFVGNITGNINATGVSTIATLNVTQSNPTNLNVSGVTTVSAGSTSAPSISPSGDSNTGIFFPSADTIAFAEGGVEAFRITSTGQLQAIGAADVRLTLGSGGTAGTNDSVHIRADGANLKFMNASGGATIFEQNGTERLRIDSSGRRTLPYQPMCYVVYTGTAIARGTRIPLVTTNGTYPGTNQGNHWSNSTNIFTCPVAGVYHASLNITGNTTQSVQCLPTIRKNSGTVAYSYYPGGGVSISILCAANDTIDFLYNHDNAGYDGASAAWASVYLLG